MNKYENGKIYKIVCNITNEIYIGSTYRNLNERLSIHKGIHKCMSKQIIDRGDYEIILIKNYPCNSRWELEEEEGKYIRNNTCINIQIPHRTKKQRYVDNKEAILKNKQNYYINNKEEIQKKHKKYREDNKEAISKKKGEKILCECGKIITRGKLARHKRSKKHLEFISNNNI